MTAPIAIRRPESPAIRSHDLSLVVKLVVNEKPPVEFDRRSSSPWGRSAGPLAGMTEPDGILLPVHR